MVDMVVTFIYTAYHGIQASETKTRLYRKVAEAVRSAEAEHE